MLKFLIDTPLPSPRIPAVAPHMVRHNYNREKPHLGYSLAFCAYFGEIVRMSSYADIGGNEIGRVERFSKCPPAIEGGQQAAAHKSVRRLKPLASGFVRVSPIRTVIMAS